MAPLSTADSRRPLVAAAAVRTFGLRGYHATTIAAVAAEARISPSYVSKLYRSKDQLFVAALEECFDQVLAALAVGADASVDQSPDAILESMGDADAALISNRALLMLQVHAQSVAEIPEIGAALRAGLERVTRFAQERSRAEDDAVQHFLAYGQLCHLIVTTGLEGIRAPWAALVTKGFSHP